MALLFPPDYIRTHGLLRSAYFWFWNFWYALVYLVFEPPWYFERPGFGLGEWGGGPFGGGVFGPGVSGAAATGGGGAGHGGGWGEGGAYAASGGYEGGGLYSVW